MINLLSAHINIRPLNIAISYYKGLNIESNMQNYNSSDKLIDHLPLVSIKPNYSACIYNAYSFPSHISG